MPEVAEPSEWGALLLGILILVFFVGYLFGHRQGVAAQFERQREIYVDKRHIIS